MGNNIFISYSRKDDADWICEGLSAVGISCWRDIDGT